MIERNLKQQFTTSVARKYLREGNSDRTFQDILPALLIMNDHPEQLRKESLPLIVPLRDAEARLAVAAVLYGVVPLCARESDEFVRRFDQKENLLEAANKVVGMKPGAFGFSLNMNELVDRWLKSRAARPKPS